MSRNSDSRQVDCGFDENTVNTQRFEMAPGDAHVDTDSKDQRTLSNRLAAAQKHEAEEEMRENAKTITDPLAPAQDHGNEPSRGAKIDARIQQEEEEYLKRKND